MDAFAAASLWGWKNGKAGYLNLNTQAGLLSLAGK
jgi:hypothetical protein